MAEKSKKPAIRFAGFTDAWEQRKLDEIVSFFSGLTYSPNDIRPTGTLVLRSSNVKDGEVIDADNVYVDPSVVNSDNVHDGDIIVVVRNGSRTLIGKHAEIKGLMPNTVIGAFMTGIRSEHPSFLNSLLSTPHFDKEIERNMGATINQITGYMFSKMEFMIPSSKEQDAIGEYFKRISNLITLHQRKYDKLVNVKKAMLEKMFPKDGADVPEIRFKGFTEAWEQRKFIDLFVEKREKTEYENEDTLLSCAINGIFLNSELFGHFRGSSTIGYLRVNKNDLILSAQNLHLGNANVNLRFEHGIISPAYKVYHLNCSNPRFVHTWVKMDDTKNFFLSATTEGASQCRKNIEWETLEKQTLLFPSLKEQDKIGKYFEYYDNLITLHQRKLEKLKNLKKACLEKMFV